VKPGSKKGPLVEPQEDKSLTVYLPERPVDGAANDALVKLLANYFNCAKSKIEIESGHTSRIKRVHVDI
jgi:uncharacterized protein YggU (UPF0235/DUF167 family)